MSDVFQSRERGFESKFQLDEEQKFKVQARRDRLFGLWVGKQLGRADLDAYAAEVVAANFEKPGDDDMLAKVRADLATAGKQVHEGTLLAELASAAVEAAKQVAAGD